jgi:phage gpG-like protein
VPYVVLFTKQTVAALERLTAKQAAATRTATAKALHLIEKEAKSALSQTSTSTDTGRDAKGRFLKHIHSASAPGDPPFLRSGALRRSIQVDGPHPTGPTSVEGQVGPTIVYGRIQELGGVAGRGAVLPARPYMQPSFEKVMPEIGVIYRDAWRAALHGV